MGSLEALVEDVAVAWFKNVPESLTGPDAQRVKVPLAQFEQMDAEDRCRFLVDQLSPGLLAGVSRFEGLLAHLGLDGAVDDGLPRSLFELNNVRNVLVHRRGVGDRKLLEACPWVPWALGATIQVTPDQYEEYERAVQGYVLILIQRVRLHFGLPDYSPGHESADPRLALRES